MVASFQQSPRRVQRYASDGHQFFFVELDHGSDPMGPTSPINDLPYRVLRYWLELRLDGANRFRSLLAP